MDVSQVAEGDLIEFETAGHMGTRRDRPTTTGYVHNIVYDTQNGDKVIHLNLFEVVPAELAQGAEHRYIVMDSLSAGDGLGLDPNKRWAIMLNPVRIVPDNKILGRKDGLIQRVGNISGTVEQQRLLHLIDQIGGDDGIYMGGAPREARPNTTNWGVYAPVGITRRDEADEETLHLGLKPPRKTKAAFEGLVLDIALHDAVKALGLDQATADLFIKPRDARLKAVTSLRRAWELAGQGPEVIGKYMPKDNTRNAPVIALKDLPENLALRIGVLNCFAEPKKNSGAKPVRDLAVAYALVTERPEELSNYFGPKMTQWAIDDITAAYNGLATDAPVSCQADDLTATIKQAWSSFTSAYLESQQTKVIPEAYRSPDGNALWKLVPKI